MRPAFQSVNQGGHELINLEKNKQQSIILETLDRVNKNWQALAIKLLNTTAKLDELQEQSEKFYAVYKHVTLWLDNMEVRQLAMPPVGLDPDVLSAQMKEQKVLWDSVSKCVFITFLSVLLNKFSNYESHRGKECSKSFVLSFLRSYRMKLSSTRPKSIFLWAWERLSLASRPNSRASRPSLLSRRI